MQVLDTNCKMDQSTTLKVHQEALFLLGASLFASPVSTPASITKAVETPKIC